MSLGSSNYGWKHKTQRFYRGMFNNYILPRWSDVPIDQITRRSVRTWLADLSATSGLAPDSVKAVYRSLSSLSAAVDDELLDTNPIQRLGRVLPAVRRDKRPPKAWHPEQLSRVLRAAREIGTLDE